MPQTAIAIGYGPRLKASADYVRELQERVKLALQARNALIVEAVDNGYGGHQTARDTGLKQPHIIRILSNSDPDVAA